MKPLLSLSLVIAAFNLSGCASLFPPSVQDMEKVPLVRFGETAPASGEFVLHYPKGVALPVEASVAGDLVADKASATLHVAPNRDIYQYKQWVSFDGKTWQSGRDALGVSINIEMPGAKDGKAAGRLDTNFSLR